ncbi:MAG: hypothetical protein M1836_007059 [Candelina mexicana]|nr:MAG: hypothetical protein M1836_007059 [Candelina mexicana]
MPSATPTSSSNPKPFSLSLGAPKPKPSPLSQKPLLPSTGTKRPHSSLRDSDDEDESTQPEPQLVSAFDHSAGGAIVSGGQNDKKAPLIIQGQRNRDWREETLRKRGRNLLPREVQAAREAERSGNGSGGKEVEVVNGEVQAYGLSFAAKSNDDVVMTNEQVQDKNGEVPTSTEPERPRTDDELALEALTSDGSSRKSNLVLPAVQAPSEDIDGYTGRATIGLNEDEAFRTDVASRPDSASLQDYAAVPVSEFGAALLRGMGWKEGDVVGKRKDQIAKPRVVERRPALLGIGAKEVPGGLGEELGAWGKGSRGKRKVDKTYNPVLLKNTKTGEMVTEEELKAKKEKQVIEEKEWRERRDRNLRVDEERKGGRGRVSSRYVSRFCVHSGRIDRFLTLRRDRDRDSDRERDRRRRDRDSDHSSSRHSSSRHERSRSTESRHRRRKDDDGDGDYDRKDRERRRRDKDDDRHYSSGSRRSYKERESYEDSSRRRRHEVY